MNALQIAFLQVLNMSITASVVIAAVILLRLPLKKAPRIFSYVLWAVVLFRLVCPFSFESAFSLIGSPDLVTRNAVGDALDYVAPDSFDAVHYSPATAPVIPLAAAVAWAAGAGSMFLYGAIGYYRLKKRISTATRKTGNVFETDRICTPFVCGLLHPRIYLPLDLKEEDYFNVLSHEQVHIRRRDNLIKPVAFLALAVHWFNPLVWLSFNLLCKDIEMSCDESILKRLDKQDKIRYSRSLLKLSYPKIRFGINPLAFGEVGIKQRVKNILHYKKPAVWVTVLTLIVVICSSFLCLANPLSAASGGSDPPSYKEIVYQTDETDKSKIAYKIFDTYLKERTNSNINSRSRLMFYTINAVKIYSNEDNEFLFYATYSVKPFNMDCWIAGNGDQYFNWVVNKICCVDVVQDGNTYRIKALGTGL